MKLLLMAFLSLMTAICLTGCQTNTTEPSTMPTTQQTSPSAPLAGTNWRLIELNGSPLVRDDDWKHAEPYLVFDAKEHRISGSSGINRIMGAYELDGNHLTIKSGGMTMMAGPEPLMKQEQTFTKALGMVKSYRITGSTLELLDGEVVVAKFEARSDR